VLAIFFPICAFVVAGFEHCVANMYYIPAGIFASNNSTYVDKACELYGYTPEQINETLTVGHFFGTNLLPVTIGNIIGGAVIMGFGLYLIYKSKICNKEK
jgi:formate/nitrite transporter FocA (FNT family)